MITYQDLLKVPEIDKDRMDFIKKAINQHKTTGLYKVAQDADLYDKHRNKTIADFQKLLYTVSGKAVPDIWSANFKMACRHFHRFIVQENRYRRLDSAQLREMFWKKSADGEYEAWMRAFCKRKYNSDFAREMSRSVAEYLKQYDQQ